MSSKRESELGWTLTKWFAGIAAAAIVLIAFVPLVGYFVLALAYSGHDSDDDLSATSEVFTGVAFLTAEQPVIEVPVSLIVQGEASPTLDLEVGAAIMTYGTTVLSQSDLLITKELGTAGSGIVRIGLADPDSGPAEVAWSMQAIRYLSDGDDGSAPVLMVDAPADTYGPPLAFDITLEPKWSPPTGRRISISAEVGATVRIQSGGARVVTEDGAVDVVNRPTAPVDLPLPNRCVPNEDCTFEIVVAAFDGRGSFRFVVYPDEDRVVVDDLGPVTWRSVTRSGVSERVTHRHTELDETEYKLAIAVEEPDERMNAALIFVHVDAEPRSTDDAGDGSEGTSWRVRAWPRKRHFWMSGCCRGAQVVVDSRLFDGDSLDVWSNWTVNVWTPDEPVSDVVVEVDPPS